MSAGTAAGRPEPRIFVSGGCRSGKSAYAQAIAEGWSPHRVYAATARVRDAEMAERVLRHQQARGPGWRLRELAPGELPDARRPLLRKGEALVFDCLSLWVSGWMEACPETDRDAFSRSVDRLVAHLLSLPGPVIVVSSEVGLGVVPGTRAGRQFRDLVGLANQKAAQAADTVAFMVSGLPLCVKGALPIRPGD